MSDYQQTALDYLLGELSSEEAASFEKLSRQEPLAEQALRQAREDLSLLGQTPKSTRPNHDLRSRILDLCQPRDYRQNLAFLEKLTRELKAASLQPSQRYGGGGALVELNDIHSSQHRDFLLRTYETYLELWPHVSGASPAAAGDLRDLRQNLESLAPVFPAHHELSSTSDLAKAANEPPSRSLHSSYLSTLPALNYFITKIRSGEGDVSDARRLFYLCRDQLKIMRSAFRDLDALRLEDDKKLRIHNTDLLLRKWRGATHSWFSDPGKIQFGDYFEGPINACRIEFAEYIANVYCLTNLLSGKSNDGQFKIDLLQGILPDSSITLVSAATSPQKHQIIAGLLPEKELLPTEQTEEHYLLNLVIASVSRASKLTGDRDALLSGRMGCVHENGRTILYFTWPELSCEDT